MAVRKKAATAVEDSNLPDTPEHTAHLRRMMACSTSHAKSSLVLQWHLTAWQFVSKLSTSFENIVKPFNKGTEEAYAHMGGLQRLSVRHMWPANTLVALLARS